MLLDLAADAGAAATDCLIDWFGPACVANGDPTDAAGECFFGGQEFDTHPTLGDGLACSAEILKAEFPNEGRRIGELAEQTRNVGEQEQPVGPEGRRGDRRGPVAIDIDCFVVVTDSRGGQDGEIVIVQECLQQPRVDGVDPAGPRIPDNPLPSVFDGPERPASVVRAIILRPAPKVQWR